MKNLSKIFILVWALVALCSCEQKSLVGVGGNNGGEDDIFLPTDGYIFFNVKHPETRGAMLDGGYLNDTLYVIGYNYAADWTTVRPQASQIKEVNYTLSNTLQTLEMGVFYSTGIDNNTQPFKTGLLPVNYTNNVHSYVFVDDANHKGLKPWIAELKHSFFAWYPTTLYANGSTGNDYNNPAYEGEPYITYDLPPGVDKDARQAMVDVLTACELDQTKYNVEQNGGSINFEMKHRLAVLDIVGTSIITAKGIKETWGIADYNNGNDVPLLDKNGVVIDTALIDNSVPVKVKEITNLTLKLDNIRTSAKIFLNTTNPNDPLTQTIVSGNHIPTYTGFETNGIELNYYSSVDEAKELVSDSEKLILIPQPDDISATLTIKYVVAVTNKNGVTYEMEYTQNNLTTTVKGLEEGHYHYLLLTFTASGIYVKAQVEEAWEPYPVYYDFE